jgi:hypothetical protein
MEETMLGFIGSHFVALVLIVSAAFTFVLGYHSIADAFAPKR